MAPGRALTVALLVVLAAVLPGAVGAQAPVTTVPTAGGAESTLGVGDEAAYRAALATLSADASGPHTIELTADITVDDGTDPTYTGSQPLTVEGHGFALDAAGTSRLLVMDSPTDAPLTLSEVTLRNGSAAGDGGGLLVRNASTVAVADSRFEENEASGSGGAVAVPLVATVSGSDFVGNVALTGNGGALSAVAGAGDFSIRGSQFVENQAPSGDGGAVSAMGAGFPSTDRGILRTSFVGNRARRGGALVLASGGTIANATIVDNAASVTGGGILAEGRSFEVAIYVTIAGNAAPEGANVALVGRDLVLIFSVLAEPMGGGANCALGGSSNLAEIHADDDSCGARHNGGAAELGPLADNGGRTLTREPLPGSPLIDVIPHNYGFPSISGGCARFQSLEPWDQRGVLRPQDGDGETRSAFAQGEPIEVAADCDIGAVEARAFVAPPTGPVPASPPFTG